MNFFKQGEQTIWDHLKSESWDEVRDCLNSESGADSAQQKDDSGKILLSCAVENYPPLDVVKTLIDLHPDALSTKDNRGRLPLHLACKAGASKEVIRVMVDKDLRGTVEMDEDDRLPVHYAVEHACRELHEGHDETVAANTVETSVAILTMLIQVAPESIYASDKANQETPMDIALRMEHEGFGRNRRASTVKSALRRISTISMIVKSHSKKKSTQNNKSGMPSFQRLGKDAKPTKRSGSAA